MELITKGIRGTQDVLPADSFQWQHMEQTALAVAADYGYREMRTPVFEHTELFLRSVGETTDVVQKEMYTFKDKGERSITLRPEGTAGAARALLEHGLHTGTLPVKISYLISCYRYEKPQAGRLREFHQFGAECFGAPAPAADAEVIALARGVLNALEVPGVTLQLNSIGCPTCRAAYLKTLERYFETHKAHLCETCLTRLTRNPMRILDCKSPVCAEIAAQAPVMLTHLCEECVTHFEGVKDCLDAAEIDYTINPHIVRGLDYYTRTVFEFVSGSTVVCGGGRYDGLIEELGGAHFPSLGFAIGLERLLLLMQEAKVTFPAPPPCELYLAPMGAAATARCFAIAARLREGGVSVECDIMGRGIKPQMKYADKRGAQYTMVIGDNELAAGTARMKNMSTGESTEVALDDSLYTTLYNQALDRQMTGLLQDLTKDD